MIPIDELKDIARARLEEAEVLYANGKYDGAVYLCGYAVEIALKARVCMTLNWASFPRENSEFKGLKSLQTHELEVLRKFSGLDVEIGTHHLTDWSIVAEWDSEARYRTPGHATSVLARDMIASTKALMEVLV